MFTKLLQDITNEIKNNQKLIINSFFWSFFHFIFWSFIIIFSLFNIASNYIDLTNFTIFQQKKTILIVWIIVFLLYQITYPFFQKKIVLFNNQSTEEETWIWEYFKIILINIINIIFSINFWISVLFTTIANWYINNNITKIIIWLRFMLIVFYKVFFSNLINIIILHKLWIIWWIVKSIHILINNFNIIAKFLILKTALFIRFTTNLIIFFTIPVIIIFFLRENTEIVYMIWLIILLTLGYINWIIEFFNIRYWNYVNKIFYK